MALVARLPRAPLRITTMSAEDSSPLGPDCAGLGVLSARPQKPLLQPCLLRIENMDSALDAAPPRHCAAPPLDAAPAPQSSTRSPLRRSRLLVSRRQRLIRTHPLAQVAAFVPASRRARAPPPPRICPAPRGPAAAQAGPLAPAGSRAGREPGLSMRGRAREGLIGAAALDGGARLPAIGGRGAWMGLGRAGRRGVSSLDAGAARGRARLPEPNHRLV